MKYILLLILSLPLYPMEFNTTVMSISIEHDDIIAPIVGISFCILTVACWCWFIRPTPEERRPLLHAHYDIDESKLRLE